MFLSGSSRGGAQRLNLGRGGGKGFNMEYLFAGALAVIILGSLILTIYFTLGGGEPSPGDLEVTFKCAKCGYEFSKKPEEVRPMGPDMMPMPMGAPGMAPIALDCPKCGAKKSAFQAVKCPNCGAFYISQITTHPVAPGEGRQLRDVCPKCGTDRIQWYREHRKK